MYEINVIFKDCLVLFLCKLHSNKYQRQLRVQEKSVKCLIFNDYPKERIIFTTSPQQRINSKYRFYTMIRQIVFQIVH